MKLLAAGLLGIALAKGHGDHEDSGYHDSTDPEAEAEPEPEPEYRYEPNRADNLCENGQHQSPIDLAFIHPQFHMHETKHAGKSNSTDGYGEEFKWHFESDGHSINLFLEDEDAEKLQLLEEDASYTFHHITFRWGDFDQGGSEHTVNHQHAFGELQAWHRMSNLTDEEALDNLNGFRVVTAFVELCEVDSSPVFNEISQRLRSKSKNDKEDGKLDKYHFSYNDFFRGVDPGSFYYYHGSHTHPEHNDCSESVGWVIMQDAIRITKDTAKNIMKMTKDEDGEYIKHNNRRTQPWYDRDVHHFSYNPQSSKMIMHNRRQFDMARHNMHMKMMHMHEEIDILKDKMKEHRQGSGKAKSGMSKNGKKSPKSR